MLSTWSVVFFEGIRLKDQWTSFILGPFCFPPRRGMSPTWGLSSGCSAGSWDSHCCLSPNRHGKNGRTSLALFSPHFMESSPESVLLSACCFWRKSWGAVEEALCWSMTNIHVGTRSVWSPSSSFAIMGKMFIANMRHCCGCAYLKLYCLVLCAVCVTSLHSVHLCLE